MLFAVHKLFSPSDNAIYINGIVSLVNVKDKRELSALVCLKTDYEDNKMKKDTLATLQYYVNNHLLNNLHQYISNILNNEQNQQFFVNKL